MDFDRVVETDIVRRNPDRFLKEAVAESAERHRQYGNSVYLLEPHLKEGEGGLRDLHTALWMAQGEVQGPARCASSCRRAWSARASSTRARVAGLSLWRVRNTLHFLTGSHQDQLTFELQERIAATLGYRRRR